MAQVQVLINKRGNPEFELVPDMALPAIPEKVVSKKPTKCPYCESKKIRGAEDFYVCEDCGMGRYYDGRRLH